MLRRTSAVVAASAPEQVAPGAGAPRRSGLVERVKQRLFPPSTGKVSAKADKPSGEPFPVAVKKNKASFQASIAEFLLVSRLKARSQPRDQTASMLERASQIIFVTCKNWFSSNEQKPTRHETRL